MSCWFNGYKMWYSIISTKWIWFQLVTRVLSHSLMILACLSTAGGPVAIEKKPEWSLIQAVGVGILSLPRRWYTILCLIFSTTPTEEKKKRVQIVDCAMVFTTANSELQKATVCLWVPLHSRCEMNEHLISHSLPLDRDTQMGWLKS